jgi:hypothetical protein
MFPSGRASSATCILLCALLSACGDDPQPTKPKPNPLPDMNVTPDMTADLDSPDDGLPDDGLPDMDGDLDVSPDDGLPDDGLPDMDGDMAPDMPRCTTNAECGAGNHCDAGECKPGACAEADKNACGGCTPLVGALGDPCGQCQKDQLACAPDGESLVCNGDTPCSAPTVTTDVPSNISQYAATLRGELLDSGDSPVIDHGFCFSTTNNPALGGADTTCSTMGPLAGPGTFTEDISGLTLATDYFVRAYATNNVGTTYGEERSLRTADAVLPTVQTVSAVAQMTDGELLVNARIDELGIPVHTRHGVCLSTQAGPALNAPGSTCTDLGVAAQTGPFTVTFQGLPLGGTYFVRAFAVSDAGAQYGQELTATLRPATPAIDTITNGTDIAKVTLTWTPVAGATGYRVYRNGNLITAQAVQGTSFDDTTAAAGGPPTNAGLNPTASSNDADKVTLTWSMGTAPRGQTYNYTITAVNSGGESAQSAPKEGARAPQPITGYEVSINGGNPIPVNGLIYNDTSAPAGTISQANATASQGTSSAAVFLSLIGADAQPGATVNYRVRARNAAGPGQDSDVFQGNRAAATLSIQWQRSSGPTDANYANLAGATTRDFADTTAPPNEVVRFYRAVITGGPSTITTAGVSGFRGANLPELMASEPTAVSQTSMTLQGAVTSMGTATTLNPHGFCYGTNPDPSYAPGNPNCISLGSRNSTGTMTPRQITGLSPGTRYYIRAFAVFDRGGNPFTVYSNNREVLTIPATPGAPSASTDDINRVRLIWTRGNNVTSYKIFRNGSLIATVPANNTLLSYDDTTAPSPQLPGQVASLTAGTRYCNGSYVNWTAPPAPGPGVNVSYTLVAVNASGDSPASPAATGRRAAAPILGYKVRNVSSNGPTTMLSDNATSAFITDLRAPAITPGTVTASDRVNTHPTYVRLTSTGAAQGAPPNDNISVRAYSALGDGADSIISQRRHDNCSLIIQWQRATAVAGPFSDIIGGVGSLYDDTGAPEDGATVYYRAFVYTAGSRFAGQETQVDSGARFSAPPALTLISVMQSAPTAAAMTVRYRVDSLGVTAITRDYGFCYTSDPSVADNNIRPDTGNMAVTCVPASRDAVEGDTHNVIATRNVTRGRTYKVRTYARNPHSIRVNTNTGGYVLSSPVLGVFLN